ncbi:MAG: signal peptidase II [Planctomycetes bacterium]|nr:signal peptidase II [Planctomycetota bacterium]MCP4839346.1 signal peptidase II [Planctomycetota bacterium]
MTLSSDRQAEEKHPRNPARRSVSAWILLVCVAAIGITLDLGSKDWAFASIAAAPIIIDREAAISNPEYAPIPPHESRIALPGDLLDFRLVLNSGAVFGIGAHQRWFFVSFSLVAIGVAIWLFGWRTERRHRMLHIGIGLILAGAIGNLWDRIQLGRVRDFLHMLPSWELPFGLSWPGGNTEVWPWIFNIADVMLLAGMALVLIDMWIRDSRAKRTGSPEPRESSA